MTAGPGGGMDPAKTRILLQRRDLLDRSQRDPAGPRFGCYRRRCGRCLCSREVSAPAPSLRSLRLARFSREGLKARLVDSTSPDWKSSRPVSTCSHAATSMMSATPRWRLPVREPSEPTQFDAPARNTRKPPSLGATMRCAGPLPEVDGLEEPTVQ